MVEVFMWRMFASSSRGVDGFPKRIIDSCVASLRSLIST